MAQQGTKKAKKSGRTTAKKKAAPKAPGTWAEFKAMHQVPTAELRFCMDQSKFHEHENAERRHNQARVQSVWDQSEKAQQELKAAAKALSEATEALEAVIVTLEARAIGRLRNKLRKEHPPLPGEVKENEALYASFDRPVIPLQYSAATYPPQVIAAAMVQPAFSEEEAKEMWDDDDFSDAQRKAIFDLCEEVNDRLIEG